MASQRIAEMLVSGEASAAGGLRGVDVSEAPWDGSCPAGSSDPGKTVPSRSASRGRGLSFGAQLEGQVQSPVSEDRQFWRQGAKPREVVRAW